MTVTTAHVPPRIIRRRRVTLGVVATVAVIVAGGAVGAPITARLFDALVAMAAVGAAWALVREVVTSAPAVAPIAAVPVRTRVRVVAGDRARSVARPLADAA